MTFLDVRSRNDLPQDPEKLQNFSWDLTLAYQRLNEKYNKVLRELYGRSSEKMAPSPELDGLQMEMEALVQKEKQLAEGCDKTSEQDTIEVTSYKRRRKHPGRNAIPEELITEVIVDVPEAEKICGCGREKVVIDRKPHVVVERKPAQYEATRFIRLVRACPCCKDGVSVAEPVALPIAKGLAGVHLLVFVMLSKYLYHLPLYRIQRQIFHESRGIWFPRPTLVSWVRHVAGLLERVHAALLHEYDRSKVKHADETPLQVNSNGHYHQGYMWVGLSGDERTAVFLYDNHRSGKAACKLLAGSSPGDYLMVDDCNAYHRPVKEVGLIDMRCMMHIRRTFIEAEKSGHHRDYHKRMLIKIGQLYRIERVAMRLKMSGEQRGELRQKYSTSIMAQIKNLLEEPGFAVLPRSDTGLAIDYFRRNWTAASRFLEDGQLPIDNGANERIIRPLTIGRNNWLHAGSEHGADWMAILYTVVTTCKLNGIDPHEYLADVLMRLPIRPANADITDLTPLGWYKARNAGKLPDPQSLYPSKN
jgi:transposase